VTASPLSDVRPAKAPTLAALGEAVGLAERSVSRNIRKGMPRDVEGARRWLAEQTAAKAQREGATRDEKAEARFWNTAWRRARAEREQLELDRIRNNYIPRSEVDANFVGFALEWVRGLELLERTLPPRLWVCESVGEMAAILEEAHRDLRQRISRERPVARPKGLWRGRGRPRKEGQ
jgi:hypothetical protein